MIRIFCVVAAMSFLCVNAQTQTNPTIAPAAPSMTNHEALRAELEAMLETDQGQRKKLSAAKDEVERKILWDSQRIVDAANQKRIDEIVKTHGWPSEKLFGFKAAQAAFLIVQHAPLEMMKRYQPVLEKAVAEGDMRESNFAMFDDRVRMYEKRPQRFGSQVTRDDASGKRVFWMIEDVVNVDARRKQMGLGSLQEYAKFFADIEMPAGYVSANATTADKAEAKK